MMSPVSDLHGNLVAVAGQGLVDGVVHDLVHQVVQAALRRGADIHAGALADGLQALQHLDLRAAVLVLHLGSAVLEFFRHLKTSIGISGGQGPPLRPRRRSRLRRPVWVVYSKLLLSARRSNVAVDSWER